MAGRASVFRSPRGEAAYMAAYDAALKLWPIPYEERDLDTRFGRVHTILSGEPDAPPLLLLHAVNASATTWSPNVEVLGTHFRLIAPDLLGHTGRSLPTRKIAGGKDSAAWLLDLLDALEVDSTAVLGLSVGGWHALNLALQAPDRVERVAACSPIGAFGPLRGSLLLRMLPMLLLPTRGTYARYIRWVSAGGESLPEPIREQFIVGMQHFDFRNPGFFLPKPFTAPELGRIGQPVLLLFGEQEVMFDYKRALEVAVAHLPEVETGVVAGAGHMLTMEQPNLVTQRLRSFLDWQVLVRG